MLFRSLAWIPIGLVGYLFLWPVGRRAAVSLWPGAADWLGTPPEFAARIASETESWGSFVTTDLWRNLPGPGIAILTFAVCGFAVVFLVGSRSFCRYACPYGAVFAFADKFAKGRIVSSGGCIGCGKCTDNCRSDVQVIEEINEFGKVVDPACLKCLDCVSVCPKDALYFGFGKVARAPRPDRPAHAKGAVIAAKKLARWKDLSLGEEALIALLFVAAFLTFRGLYGAVPFLFALGLAATLAFIGLLTVRMLTKESVRLQTSVLKSSGTLTGSGRTFLGFSLVLGPFWTHSAVIQVQDASS